MCPSTQGGAAGLFKPAGGQERKRRQRPAAGGPSWVHPGLATLHQRVRNRVDIPSICMHPMLLSHAYQIIQISVMVPSASPGLSFGSAAPDPQLRHAALPKHKPRAHVSWHAAACMQPPSRPPSHAACGQLLAGNSPLQAKARYNKHASSQTTGQLLTAHIPSSARPPCLQDGRHAHSSQAWSLHRLQPAVQPGSRAAG